MGAARPAAVTLGEQYNRSVGNCMVFPTDVVRQLGILILSESFKFVSDDVGKWLLELKREGSIRFPLAVGDQSPHGNKSATLLVFEIGEVDEEDTKLLMT